MVRVVVFVVTELIFIFKFFGTRLKLCLPKSSFGVLLSLFSLTSSSRHRSLNRVCSCLFFSVKHPGTSITESDFEAGRVRPLARGRAALDADPFLLCALAGVVPVLVRLHFVVVHRAVVAQQADT